MSRLSSSPSHALPVTYRPEIDGLRAFAIVPVILFHLFPRYLPGGFVGVDVFFVISGYLITSILLRELREGSFSLLRFWRRRAQRLGTALGSMVLGTCLLGAALLYRSDLPSLGEQGLAALLSYGNILYWQLAGNYWGAAANELVMLHTWSLGVEEQFYLLFPLLLALTHRWWPRRLWVLLLTLTLVSFGLCLYTAQHRPGAGFYLLPSRVWELGAGALLASWHSAPLPPSKATGLLRHATSVGLLLVVGATLFVTEAGGYPGVTTLVPVLGAALVIAARNRLPSWSRRLLEAAPVRYVGRASYSLYLWHWPLIVLNRLAGEAFHPSLPTWLLPVPIFALGLGSYHFVEPLGRHPRRWHVYAAALVASALALCVYFARFAPTHADLRGFSPVTWLGRTFDVTPTQEPWTGQLAQRTEGLVAPLRAQPRSDAYLRGGVMMPEDGKAPDLWVLGDSHALMWAATLDSVARALHASILFSAMDGLEPEFGPIPRAAASQVLTATQQRDFDLAREKLLIERTPRVIILVQKWNRSGMNWERHEEFLRHLTSHGSRVLLLTQPPVLGYGDRNALHVAAELRERGALTATLPIAKDDGWSRARVELEASAENCHACTLLDLTPLYTGSAGQALFLTEQGLLYIDDDHLSQVGASRATELLHQTLSRLLSETQGSAP